MAYRDWGAKTGGGGVASKEHEALARKQRLRELAMDTVDLKNDPYFMRNHLGTYECKLCLTLHANEGNYLAHTQGRRHQSNLKRRAARESQKEAAKPRAPIAYATQTKFDDRLKIGTPGYQITKQKDPDTAQLSLLFQLSYPQIADALQPRHRFMSAFEQRKEPPDRRYQYLLFAAEPYETVAFKIPNIPIDKTEGRFYTNWDPEGKTFTLQLFFENSEAHAKTNGSVQEPAVAQKVYNENEASKPKDPFAGIDHPM
ncbi:unnamed protein product [Agarophyton chilense]